MVAAGNKCKCLSSVKHNTKTIYHHHRRRHIFKILQNVRFIFTLNEKKTMQVFEGLK